MKQISYLLLMALFPVLVFAQKEKPAPVNGWEIREEIPNDEDPKSFRLKKFKELKDKQSTYFNMPQGKWYFGIKAGYSFPLLTVNRRNVEDYLGVSDYFESAAGEISDKTVVTNDGGGIKAAIYGGYQFNPFVAAEIELNYSDGKNSLQGRVTSPNFSSELTTRGRSLAINPQLVLTTPNLGNFRMFMKAGIYMPMWVDAKGDAFIDDRNGTFLKSIATTSDARFLEVVDVIAELIGQNVDGLGFLDEGFFKAIGYDFNYTGNADIDFRIDRNAIGFTGSIGVVYQISPFIGIALEGRGGGFSITTRSYQLNDIEASLDIFGNRDYLVFTDEGVVVDGQMTIPSEELAWLFNVEYDYEIDQDSNNELLNPNGIDPRKPTDRLALRRSVYDYSFSLSIQFNFKGKAK